MSLIVGSLIWAADTAAAQRRGTRVTVGLFGDSVTQSVLIPDFQRDGLAPQLARAERAFGYLPGGPGLISASPDFWHYSQPVDVTGGAVPATGWVTLGTSEHNYGTDGPSGFSAVTGSSLATASTTVNREDIEVLYNSSSVHCPFTVTTPGRSWTIDTYRAGPEVDTDSSIQIPPGKQELTVHGPACGTLSFDGVVVQRPVPPGRTQVEINNLGHAGELPSAAFTPGVQEAIRQQRYDISVFLWGYSAEIDVSGANSATYVRTMIRRARLARAHGGSCLIVAPTPIMVPSFQTRRASSLDRTVARRAGCTYTTVLAHLWGSPAAAERRGLLLVDGIHPSKTGYTLISHALAPVLAGLIRAHAG